MPFALVILLESVRNGYGSIAQILAIHGIHGGIACLKAGEIDKGETLGLARFRIAHNLWRLQYDAKGRERIVEQLLVHLDVQIANEYVGADVQILLMRRCLVDTYRLAIQLDHVHYFDRIVGVLLAEELHKAVALMHLCDPILGHVHIDCKTRINRSESRANQ